jgi:hypothetical protein
VPRPSAQPKWDHPPQCWSHSSLSLGSKIAAPHFLMATPLLVEAAS